MAIRASYALPGIFEPVRIGDRYLFDGALVNPIPVTVCRALGADFVIAVNVTADTMYRSAVIRDHQSAAATPTDAGSKGPFAGRVRGRASKAACCRDISSGAPATRRMSRRR